MLRVKPVLALVAAMLPVQMAGAAAVVDQSQTIYSRLGGHAGMSLIDRSFRRVQTFTAGLTGLLDRIEVPLLATSPLSFNLLKVVDGVPTFEVLKTGTFGGFAADGWASFDVGFAQVAGQVYAYEVVADTDRNEDYVFVSYDQTYAGGSDFYLNVPYGTTSFQSSGRDAAFRTLVSQQVAGPVPEPAAWAMMVVGFGLAGSTLRRRRPRPVAA